MPEEQINIQKLMEEIKKEAAEKKAKNPLQAVFAPVHEAGATTTTLVEDEKIETGFANLETLTAEELAQAGIEEYQEILVDSHIIFEKPIQGNSLTKPVKKFIRKLVRFCIAPVIEEQNHFNKELLSATNILKRDYVSLIKEHYQLKKGILQLQNEQYQLEKDFFALKTENECLQADIFDLERQLSLVKKHEET